VVALLFAEASRFWLQKEGGFVNGAEIYKNSGIKKKEELGRKCWIFSWAMSHICANDEYRSQVGPTNRPENVAIRFVSFVSLSL
jgi:hypothetical protein